MLIFLLATTSLSCSKDDDEKPDDSQTSAELIQGKWNLNSVHYDYLDASNNLLFRDPEEDTKGTWELDGKVVVIIDADDDDDVESSTYTITQEGADQYINFTASTDLQRLRIYSLDENSMVLGDDFGPDTYEENGVQKQAANSSVRANFTR